MRSLLLTIGLAFVVGASALAGQEIGDRVRVRLLEDQHWTEGTLIDLGDDAVLVRGPVLGDVGTSFGVFEIQRADWYAPNSVALTILGGVAGSAVFLLTSPCEPLEGTCVTGTTGGHAAVTRGLGVAIGVIVHLITPGRWKKWIEDGQLVG